MMRKCKAWLAANGGLKGEEGFKVPYGPYWWLAIGEALMKLILPVEYYQVRKNGVREWDDVGWFAYQSDLGRYPDLPSDEARHRQSLFDFYCAEGKALELEPGQAARYAMNRIGYLEGDGRELDPQLFLDLETAIERTMKTVPA